MSNAVVLQYKRAGTSLSTVYADRSQKHLKMYVSIDIQTDYV